MKALENHFCCHYHSCLDCVTCNKSWIWEDHDHNKQITYLDVLISFPSYWFTEMVVKWERSHWQKSVFPSGGGNNFLSLCCYLLAMELEQEMCHVKPVPSLKGHDHEPFSLWKLFWEIIFPYGFTNFYASFFDLY